MRTKKVFSRAVLSFVLAVCGLGWAVAKGAVTLQAPIQFFLVERVQSSRNEKIQFAPEIKNTFVRAFKLAGFHVLSELEPPFISKEHEKYNQPHTGGVASSGIGYVHRQPQENGKSEFLSDTGQQISPKSDIDSIYWVLDRKEALSIADNAGAKYAFFVEVSVHPAFQAESPKPVYTVILTASLCETVSGREVFAYKDSMLKQGWKPLSAALGACQYMGQRMVQRMQATQ
jgi:hypothetical protein